MGLIRAKHPAGRSGKSGPCPFSFAPAANLLPLAKGDPNVLDLTGNLRGSSKPVQASFAEDVRRVTGLKSDIRFSASKLKWLVRNRPEIEQKLRGGEAPIGIIDPYLISRPTQGRTFTTDCANPRDILVPPSAADRAAADGHDL